MCELSNKKLCTNNKCHICYVKSFASNPYAINWSPNNDCSPRQISIRCSIKKKFICPKCGHEYETGPNSITTNHHKCIFCANLKLCDDLECNTCSAKSLLVDPICEYWSDENDKSPREIFKSSSIKVKIVCPTCKHTYEMTPATITSKENPCPCPYCCNPPQKLCGSMQCEHCLCKSFFYHEKAEYWSEKNDTTPILVFMGSKKKFWFKCYCGHEFLTSLYSITGLNSWCPFCCPIPKKLCNNENCRMCYLNSFASCYQSIFMTDDNEKTARQIAKYSGIKCSFHCINCNNIYIAAVYSVTRGSWCNCRHNKTENKLYEFLKTIINTEIKRQKRFDWCKRQICCSFDFFIKELGLIIELDGRQHFVQVSNWDSPEINQKNDLYKMKCCNLHNYSVIRIYQPLVWENKEDWDSQLKQAIKKYDEPTNIYIGKIYDSYRHVYNL
jgi:very-short-patch-repair endonuclease